MKLTPTQIKISDIIETFENSAPNKYGGLTVIKGDTGGISGGELMASLSSGSLGKLCRLYATNGGHQIPENLIRMAEAKDTALNTSAEFKAAWKAAATDPIMARSQDEFFYLGYQLPGEQWGKTYGFNLPLSIAVLMDSFVHGSFHKIAALVKVPHDERTWITEYVKLRRIWLANNKNPVLQNCVYRMDTFLEQIQKGNWTLDGPINVHVGKSIVVVN